MPSSIEGRSIRLEVNSAKNLQVPFDRIPAGIYISINIDLRRRWKSAIRVPLFDRSVSWGHTVILSSQALPALSVEIRASYEVDRTLGKGEVIGTLETSWDELLDHGDEPFELSFPPVRGVNPSLTLKAALVHACDNMDGALFDFFMDRKIARDTDVGHARLAEYVTRRTVSYLNDAIQHFKLVLDQCPVNHPDHAAALTNLAWARLQGYIQKELQDIDTITSLLCEALALRPQGHPDHTLSSYHLITSLNWRYSKQQSAIYIQESAQLCCKLLPLCPEGTYLRSIGVNNAVDYVFSACNNLPIDASDEGIHLRRVVLELSPLGHQHRPLSLTRLAQAVEAQFLQRGNIDDVDESIQLGREAVSLCPEGHSDRNTFLNNLASSLQSRFDHQGNYRDLNEAIIMHEEALLLCPVGHENRDLSLGNLGGALRARFNKYGDVGDIYRAISLRREALTLRPPGQPRRDTTLANLALALDTRYDKLDVIEDLHEAIELYRESLWVMRLDHPARHRTLNNLSSALRSRFTRTRRNEDVEEAIRLCQESLVALPSLHPDRYFSYMWLKNVYLSRYQMKHNPADLSLAVENYKLASRHPTQGLPQRIIVSYKWTVHAEQHGDGSALEAYSTFFELLDAHLATRSSPASRREAASAFHYARSLPVDAASCAIRRDNIQHAVELVEQGRGQQWSLASRLRNPLEDLKSANPNLAHKLSELSKCLSDTQGSAG